MKNLFRAFLTAAALVILAAALTVSSAAESYKRGDVDGDGVQGTPKDAMYLARYIAGWAGYDKLIHPEACDIDKDGTPATVRDAIVLARFIAGWTEYKDLFVNAVFKEGKCGEKLFWRLYDDGLLEIYGEGEMTSHPWWNEYYSELHIIITSTKKGLKYDDLCISELLLIGK